MTCKRLRQKEKFHFGDSGGIPEFFLKNMMIGMTDLILLLFKRLVMATVCLIINKEDKPLIDMAVDPKRYCW